MFYSEQLISLKQENLTVDKYDQFQINYLHALKESQANDLASYIRGLRPDMQEDINFSWKTFKKHKTKHPMLRTDLTFWFMTILVSSSKIEEQILSSHMHHLLHHCVIKEIFFKATLHENYQLSYNIHWTKSWTHLVKNYTPLFSHPSIHFTSSIEQKTEKKKTKKSTKGPIFSSRQFITMSWIQEINDRRVHYLYFFLLEWVYYLYSIEDNFTFFKYDY